ncbi:hypothetical protein DM02DRAFT_428256 [Periconia macrospinosa]|uniref:Uncharacterized protein n=1 Tax=Periconia macrospinosa TaxID=97972 RepID=A0A2V1E8Z7_9PLEO|nr:hypothetical protein DM02DRAFT_428256 [Periconia macrospinosa]
MGVYEGATGWEGVERERVRCRCGWSEGKCGGSGSGSSRGGSCWRWREAEGGKDGGFQQRTRTEKGRGLGLEGALAHATQDPRRTTKKWAGLWKEGGGARGAEWGGQRGRRMLASKRQQAAEQSRAEQRQSKKESRKGVGVGVGGVGRIGNPRREAGGCSATGNCNWGSRAGQGSLQGRAGQGRGRTGRARNWRQRQKQRLPQRCIRCQSHWQKVWKKRRSTHRRHRVCSTVQ